MGNDAIKHFFENEKEYSDFYFSEMDNNNYKRVREVLSEVSSNDLYIFLCGHERCIATKHATEGVRKFFVLHYVIDGIGYLECENGKYKIGAGDVFICYANEVVRYYPDKDDPWEYIHISFSGILQDEVVRQMGFARNNHVIRSAGEKVRNGFYELLENVTTYGERSFKTIGTMYSLVGDISDVLGVAHKKTTQKEKYIRQAAKFIFNNIQSVTVEDIAKNCVLSEEYLTRICREILGISLKELITVYRMQIARNYLKNTRITVKNLSEYLGYCNKKYFIRVFRDSFGMTPTQFRQHEQEKEK